MFYEDIVNGILSKIMFLLMTVRICKVEAVDFETNHQSEFFHFK